MIQKIVKPEGLREPGGAYSHVVVAKGWVFVAGQGPEDPGSGSIPQSFEEQVTQAIRNVQSALQSVGCGLEDIVKVNAYLKDLTLFSRYNEIYAQMMPTERPARTTIATGLIGMEIELDCIAVVPSGTE